MGSSVEIVVEDPMTPAAQELIHLLSAELAARYDCDADDDSGFSPADVRVPRAAFLVARLAGVPVGCGALRPMHLAGFENCAEVKRMYVSPEVRGRRLAGAILERLEGLAREFGYGRLVLQTGNAQPEAVRLYERHGYAVIPNYDPYVGEEWSICFAKAL